MLDHMQQGLLYGSKHKRLEISMGEFYQHIQAEIQET